MKLLKLQRILLTGFLVLLDQVSKAWVMSALVPGSSLALFPGAQLTLAMNRGIAFSQFHSASGWQYILLVAVISLIAVTVFICMLRSHGKWQSIGWILLTAGALGNLFDRVHHGFIIDFIDVYYKQWHWPVFNVADIQIFIGVCMLGLIWCKQERDSV